MINGIHRDKQKILSLDRETVGELKLSWRWMLPACQATHLGLPERSHSAAGRGLTSFRSSPRELSSGNSPPLQGQSSVVKAEKPVPVALAGVPAWKEFTQPADFHFLACYLLPWAQKPLLCPVSFSWRSPQGCGRVPAPRLLPARFRGCAESPAPCGTSGGLVNGSDGERHVKWEQKASNQRQGRNSH